MSKPKNIVEVAKHFTDMAKDIERYNLAVMAAKYSAAERK